MNTKAAIISQPLTRPRRLDGQTLSVVDQGIGIAKQDQAKIFDRFYRSDEARTRGHSSGYGLGLAIAKVVADKTATN